MEANDPTVSQPTDSEYATHRAVARLTARLATLDLDPPTFELLTAALTADVCDHIDTLTHN